MRHLRQAIALVVVMSLASEPAPIFGVLYRDGIGPTSFCSTRVAEEALSERLLAIWHPDESSKFTRRIPVLALPYVFLALLHPRYTFGQGHASEPAPQSPSTLSEKANLVKFFSGSEWTRLIDQPSERSANAVNALLNKSENRLFGNDLQSVVARIHAYLPYLYQVNRSSTEAAPREQLLLQAWRAFMVTHLKSLGLFGIIRVPPSGSQRLVF
jgi:hypothetical protein